MATIYEVAKLAGVSPATVSRVFNGTPVSEVYAARVRVAVEQLNYSPNRTARSLRRRSSEVVALIIPDIENPFFTAIARGVEDRASAAGYSVVLCNTDEQHDKESRYLQVAVSEHMAGVILAAATDHPDLSALVGRDTPVVAVDRSAHGFELDTVLVDNVAVAVSATERLFAAGCAVVACITGPESVDTAQQRAMGWRRVFQAHRPDLDPATYLRHSDFRVEGGREAMEALMTLAEPPPAVFVANNLMGVGALKALEGREDVQVIVLGDMPFGMLQHPHATVLPLPSRELGSRAADLLLDRIRGDKSPAKFEIVSI